MKTKLWNLRDENDIPDGYIYYIGNDNEQKAAAYGNELNDNFDWLVKKCQVVYFDARGNVVGSGEKYNISCLSRNFR